MITRSRWDDFPALSARFAGQESLHRRQMLAYGHIYVEANCGRDLLTSRCFTFEDVQAFVAWVVDEFAYMFESTPEAVQLRSDDYVYAPDDQRMPCAPVIEIEARLIGFNAELQDRLEDVDRRREGAPGSVIPVTLADYAGLAAWVHGEVLRIRPLNYGNLFAAQLSAWWMVRLCGMVAPIAPLPDDGSDYGDLDAYDFAVGYSLREADPSAADQLLMGAIADQLKRFLVRNAHRYGTNARAADNESGGA
jgi:hypothetical protein